MRTVDPHLLEDKMDEAVSHYINSHQQNEGVHVDANSLSLNIHDDGGNRVVTVMHPQSFSSHMCRPVAVSEQVSDGHWGEDIMDHESRIAALAAHLAQHSRTIHHQISSHHKVPTSRSDVDTSVMLDTPLRLFNGHNLDHPSDNLVLEVGPLPPLPPLQGIKRCPDTDWFNKTKNTLKDDQILSEGEQHLDMNAGASPAQHKHSKKSLPHKKRISKKLKRNNGSGTPQQGIVVINCNEMQQEEILPDNFVTQQQQLVEESHHMAAEVRAIFICQLCGDFYGDEQLKFYQHLKQHYEPHATIIIENPVSDLGIDKMTNTCIVDNVATLPDSIVELSLENTMPKTSIYQPIEKHISYITSSEKSLNYTNSKVQYSTASMDKEFSPEQEKSEFYDSLTKVESFSCTKCNKSFRKQKHCEQHIKEMHNKQIEEMNEFSEPEDLMEGIHVTVEETGEQYEHTLLPTLTVDNGHVTNEQVRHHWYAQNRTTSNTHPTAGQLSCSDDAYCPMCPSRDHQPQQLKEEVFQRIFENEMEVPNDQTFPAIMEPERPTDIQTPEESNEHTKDDEKKKGLGISCPHCAKVFKHRNSLMYHVLSHRGKRSHVCAECGKGFYTSGALKVHCRVHSGDKPYKCTYCEKFFRQFGDLKYHIASLHTTEKPYKCEFCDKSFSRKYSLSVHRRIHTGEKNYKCEYCSKTFRASSYRLTHMRVHTGYKPHKCSKCDKCFRVRADLRRHLAVHDKAKTKPESKSKEKKETKPKISIKSELDEVTDSKILIEVPANENDQSNVVSSQKTPILKSLLKQKTSKPKKCKKVASAPNVTVTNTKSGEVFKIAQNVIRNTDTRTDDPTKLQNDNRRNKIVFTEFKDAFSQNIVVNKHKDKLDDKEWATLKPIIRPNNSPEVCDKEVIIKPDNTDGKMTVFTQIEKKEYNGPIVPNNQVTLNEIRQHLEFREAHGEIIEHGLFERLSNFYNLPT